MSSPTKVYWDACIWISLIMEEPGRVERCEYFIDEARKGEFQIWTSSISHAEVYKTKCGNGQNQIQETKDAAFEDFLIQPFVYQRPADHDIGVLARTLLRKHSKLKKPNDAIHLATAILSDVDQLHTTDKDDLLHLDGKLLRVDGQPLEICEVPDLPAGAQQKMTLKAADDPGRQAADSDAVPKSR